MADINISVALDSAKAEQSAKNLDDKLKGMGASADAAKTPFDGLWKQIFAGVSVAAIAGKAVQGFTDFIKDSITAAIEAEKVESALKSALGATGREVAGNATHFIEYAKSLQKVTIYDDEAVKGAQALLLQLTTLDRDGIDAATRGAIGLASVLGIDLQSAAMLVSKAMEGNTAALGRYGIKVSETGTAEEKRNELLEKLEVFYKRATDATGTFAGKQAQLKNNLDDFKETVGKAIIENKTLQKTVEDLSLGFQYLSEHGETLKKVISGIMLAAQGGGLGLLLAILAKLANVQREINKEGEKAQFWASEYNDALLAIAKSGGDLTKLPIVAFFVEWAKGTEKGQAALRLTEEEAKKLGIRLRSQVIEDIKDTELALKKLRTTAGEGTPGAIVVLEKKLADLHKYLSSTEMLADKFGFTLRSKVEKDLRDTTAALELMRKSTEQTPAAIDALEKKIKELNAVLHPEAKLLEDMGIISMPKVKEEMKLLAIQQGVLESEYKKGNVTLADYKKKIDEISLKLRQYAAILKGEVIPINRTWVLEAISGGAKVDREDVKGYLAKVSRLQAWISKNREAIDQITGLSLQALGTLQAAYSVNYSNRMIELDEESRKKQEAMDADYERRKADIENSTLSEEEKQAALETLDKEYADKKEIAEKEYEDKKRALQKQAGERQRAAAIAQAIINTAQAVTKAWTEGVFAGPILAAFVGLMGAAQIAIIASQKIPLARGAIFDRPTLLAGGRYEVGDAGKEAALPVEPLMKRIEAAVKGRDLHITIPVSIYLDGQKLDERIIKVTKRQGDLGRLKLASKVVG